VRRELDDREAEVQREMKKLIKAQREDGYEEMAMETSRKREEWFQRNKEHLRLKGSDVRKAYTLLLIRYLCIDPAEVPVVYEDETKIVWRSTNFCPLLEACGRLGLDTKAVCRSQELPAQELISKVNPSLKFSRNYDRIRPGSPYCEEMIELR
jgi:hypothetical protein